VQTVFCSGALTDCGFENASAKCGLSRLDRLSACSSVFTATRVGIEPEASSCENRGMGGYGKKIVPKLQKCLTVRPPRMSAIDGRAARDFRRGLAQELVAAEEATDDDIAAEIDKFKP
jgi:hypothetical protein